MKKLFAICVALVCTIVAWAEGIEITIEFLDGTSSQHNEVRSMIFKGNTANSVTIKTIDGSENTISNVRTIIFNNDATVNTVGIIAKNGIKVYPNPTTTQITLEGVLGIITIYNLDGSVLKQIQSIDSICKIDIGEFSSGIYLVRIGNETIKITKK